MSGLMSSLDWIEVTGWLGAVFTLAAYSMRTMIIFRFVALLSNFFFLLYGVFAEIYPTLVLHVALLGLNLYRLWQIRRDVRLARSGSDWDIALAPYMTELRVHAGETLFVKGAAPDRVYLIVAGEVRLPEIGKTLGAGDLLGEIGFFTNARKRTMSAVCETDCHFLTADEDAFIKAWYQSPALGMSILKLVASRLDENARRT